VGRLAEEIERDAAFRPFYLNFKANNLTSELLKDLEN
jgi:hypothetical protein